MGSEMDEHFPRSFDLRESGSFKTKRGFNNNNLSWNLRNISLKEMKEMGVDILTHTEEENGILRTLSPCTSRVSGLSADEPEIKNAKKIKVFTEETFLYKQKAALSQASEEDLFAKLSDEMVLCILGNLSHATLAVVACVCQRLARLCRDESLWPRLDLGHRYLQTDSLGHVLRRGVRFLRLAGAKVRSPVFLETLSLMQGFSAKLEFLDLSECNIALKDLKQFLSKCRFLKKLSLEACEVDSSVCRQISFNTHLVTLNACLVSGFTWEALKQILTQCTRLEELNLGWSLTDRESVVVVCSCMPHTLTRLNLSGCQTTLTDAHVGMLGERCRKLRELDLSDCLALTADVIPLIVKRMPHLEALSLSRCFKISPKALLSLGTMANLERLNVFRHITAEQMEVLENLLPRLQFNREPFSKIARPTVGMRRTSIWQMRCRE